MNWEGKRVMVTGGLGMIGQELVIKLNELGAKVTPIDIKFGPNEDLREYSNCKIVLEAFEPEYVFHLAGVKGNVWKTANEPADFIAPMLQFNSNMIIACQELKIPNFLYTSSIAAENMETDMYPAWAKLTGEKLIEAMRIQYLNGTKFCIVRPANVYGRFDDLDNPEKRGMVVTSLIAKALKQPELEIWGDGGDIRDFINAKDVADGMIKCMEEMPNYPVNLCSGEEVKIKELGEIIGNLTNKKVTFDTTKPNGATRRVMKINWDFKPKISLEEGIKEVIEWKTKSVS